MSKLKPFQAASVPSLILSVAFLFGCKVPPSTTLENRQSAREISGQSEAIRKGAEDRLLECKRIAWGKLVEQMKLKGDPVPGRPHLYTPKVPGGFDEGIDQQQRDDAGCIAAYHRELNAIESQVPASKAKP